MPIHRRRSKLVATGKYKFPGTKHFLAYCNNGVCRWFYIVAKWNLCSGKERNHRRYLRQPQSSRTSWAGEDTARQGITFLSNSQQLSPRGDYRAVQTLRLSQLAAIRRIVLQQAIVQTIQHLTYWPREKNYIFRHEGKLVNGVLHHYIHCVAFRFRERLTLKTKENYCSRLSGEALRLCENLLFPRVGETFRRWSSRSLQLKNARGVAHIE